MSATAFRGAIQRRLVDRSWRLTAVAGALAVGAVAIAVDGGVIAVALVLAAVAVLLGAFVLLPTALRIARTRRGWIAFALLLGVVLFWCGIWIAKASTATPGSVAASLLPPRSLRLLPLLVIVGVTAAGMVLIADAVRVWLAARGLIGEGEPGHDG